MTETWFKGRVYTDNHRAKFDHDTDQHGENNHLHVDHEEHGRKHHVDAGPMYYGSCHMQHQVLFVCLASACYMLTTDTSASTCCCHWSLTTVSSSPSSPCSQHHRWS